MKKRSVLTILSCLIRSSQSSDQHAPHEIIVISISGVIAIDDVELALDPNEFLFAEQLYSP